MLAFLIGCIGARLALAYALSVAGKGALKWLSVVTGAMATGFLLIYVFGWRKTGLEASKDFSAQAPIWWDALRPLHALAYGLAAVFAWRGRGSLAARVVVLDALIGLSAFALHRSHALA